MNDRSRHLEGSPFRGIAMPADERARAERMLRHAERLADIVIGVFRTPRSLFAHRRSRTTA